MNAHGWIVLDKPPGLGSTSAVSAVKRALRQAGYAKAKVGHGGTLDPLATGVLPIAIGEATKVAWCMLDATKAYTFTLQFGRETDTLDREGHVVATSAVQPPRGAVAAIVAERFTGLIDQSPPAYSAIRIDGRRAYDRARAGEALVMTPRQVTIHGWDAVCEADLGGERAVTLTVTVSKGTYIRSLARDIALALGTVGHITMLRRLRAGPFHLAQAISLDKLDELAKGATLRQAVLPLEAALDDIPAFDLDPASVKAVRLGQTVTGLPQSDGLWLARCGIVPVALVNLTDGTLRVQRGFNVPDVAE